MKENTQCLDRGFIYTDDRIFFSICGNLHSKEAIFGMPYYFPTKEIEEIMDIQINEFSLMRGEKYTKLLTQITRNSYPDFIKDNYPDYYYSPPMWEILMKVDKTKIRNIINPKRKTNQILNYMAEHYTDENPVLYTIKQIEETDPILLKNMGIGGSTLLRDDFLTPGNDLDLIFYNRSMVLRAEEFSRLMRSVDNRFTNLDGKRLTEYVDQRIGQIGTTRDSVYRLVKDRWDVLYVDGIKLDLSFADRSFSLPMTSYESQSSGEPVKINTKITDISDSCFMPTVLGIENEGINKVVITKRGCICLFELNQVVEITGIKYHVDETKSDIVLVDEFNGGDITIV